MTSAPPSTSEKAFAREAADSELGSLIRQTAVQTRTTVRKNATGSAVINPNEVAIFRCGNSGDVLDLSSAVFRWANLQATMAGLAQPRFQNGAAWAIVKTVICRAGGATLATLQNVNLY